MRCVCIGSHLHHVSLSWKEYYMSRPWCPGFGVEDPAAAAIRRVAADPTCLLSVQTGDEMIIHPEDVPG